MSDHETAKGTVRLRGYPTTTADVEMTYRRPRQRMTSAVVILVEALVAAPIVFFIPPHIPWVLLVLGIGSYLAYRRFSGEYVIHAFDATCPNCGKPLAIKPGAFVRLPHRVPCYECHHEPELVAFEDGVPAPAT